jgi:signal transduction histidine kinase
MVFKSVNKGLPVECRSDCSGLHSSNKPKVKYLNFDIAIKDQGDGMSEQTLQNLFINFRTLESKDHKQL